MSPELPVDTPRKAVQAYIVTREKKAPDRGGQQR